VLLFLKNVLKRCCGRPLAWTDHKPWYDWLLDFLDYEYECELWRSRSLIESWFGNFKYRARRFYHRFLPHNSGSSTRSWLTAFATPQCDALSLTS
jgi:transposase-like protein